MCSLSKSIRGVQHSFQPSEADIENPRAQHQICMATEHDRNEPTFYTAALKRSSLVRRWLAAFFRRHAKEIRTSTPEKHQAAKVYAENECVMPYAARIDSNPFLLFAGNNRRCCLCVCVCGSIFIVVEPWLVAVICTKSFSALAIPMAEICVYIHVNSRSQAS